jgi:hypothetical protein
MGAVGVKGATAASEATCSGMRSLSSVLESQRVIRAARAASLTEAAADCVYTSTAAEKVTSHPIDRRTAKRVYFDGGRYVSLERLERDRCVYFTDGPRAEWCYVYSSPGLAEAMAGEGLPTRLPDWRDEEDKARDMRAVLRLWYRTLHEDVDRLGGTWENYDPRWRGFITEDEAALIHGRIDGEVKAQGYWDDDLPAQWWRDEPRKTS